jgi:hypothetical protein
MVADMIVVGGQMCTDTVEREKLRKGGREEKMMCGRQLERRDKGRQRE